MSSINVTNIKHPSSASNNIVLDASGNVNIDSNTLYVDATNNRVGVGTNVVNSLFEVRGSSDGQNILHLSNNAGTSDGGATNVIRSTCNGNTNWSNLRYDAYEHSWNVNSSEAMRIDGAKRLLVGTSASIESDALIQSSRASGANVTYITSSLINGQSCRFQSTANGRTVALGVYKHAGITNNCGYLELRAEDNQASYLWTDNSDVLRISSDATHIGTTSGTVVGTQTSDERIKNILGPVEYGLDTIKQIEPVRFALKSEPETEKLGFIAQQVQPLVPQSVFDTNEHIEGEPEDAPTKLGMEYVSLIPVLVNAIKELSAEVDALKAQLAQQP